MIKGKTFGFYDFSYSPYALGDTITWLMNVRVKASEIDSDISLNLFIDPKKPFSKYQNYINEYNYHKYIDEIISILSIVDPFEINLITKRNDWYFQIKQALKNKNNTWPSLFNLLINHLDFSSHDNIDNFFKKNEYLPNLYKNNTLSKDLKKLLLKTKKKIITVNFRQSNFSEYPNSNHRNSSSNDWLNFFSKIGDKYPKYLFLLLGEQSKYDQKFFLLKNILSIRDSGFKLIDELKLILNGYPFFGTSSGFSAVATFSESPYYILKYEHNSSKYVNLKIGDQHFIFAKKNQFLDWDEDNYPNILKKFIKFKKLI